ncbi:MAG: AAA family ATPase [Actinobacteria bacterium]|nr:AAA family ATPase [Actinomycetota bacterium]
MILTLLFTDVVGPGGAGDEPGEADRRAHLAMVQDALHDHDHADLVNLGDGVLVTLRSATAGVLAAGAIERAAADRTGGALPTRAAIHVGEAGDEAVGLSAAASLVARLCRRAGPGEVLATGVVVALAGSRVEMAMTEREVDAGESDAGPGGVYQLEWRAPAPRQAVDPFVLPRPDEIFLGRDAELARLGDLWEGVKAGGTGVAVLTGEPGIGKSALARAFARQTHGAGAVVLHGACDEDLQAPYQPFIEAIRAYATGHVDELARVGASAARLARIVPEITTLVPGLTRREGGDPEIERLLLFEAVVDLISAAARQAPVVLVLDDLHWASRPTLQMLGHLCKARLPSVLVVLCYRNTELADAPGLWELVSDLHRLPAVATLTLGGLHESDVQAYVDAAAGPAAEPGLGTVLYSKTEGNPLFVREMLAHLREVAALDMPVEVRDVIERRLYRISPAAREALAAGAVAGPSFSFSVLERVPEVSADPDALVANLEEAAAAGLVREVVGDRFRFSHALVREALYSGLTTPRRLRLHRSVAKALETLPGPPDTERLTELAHHYTEAAPLGCAEDAVRYLKSAAERARDALAFDTSVAHLQQALTLVGAVEDVALRRRLELDLLLMLGPIQSAAFGLGDARITETYARAEELAREVGDNAERFRAVQGVFSYWVGKPDHRRSGPLGDELVGLAEEIAHPAMRFAAHAWRGATRYMAGDRGGASEDFSVALEIYDPARSPLDLLDPGLTAMVFSALLDWDLGRDESALDQAAAASDIVRGRHPYTVAYVKAHVAKLHARRGDAELAARLAAEAQAVAEEHGLPQLVHQAGWVAGWARALAGRVDEGADLVEAALAGLSASNSMADASHALVVLTELRAALGQFDAAREVAARAEAFIDDTGERCHEAELQRLLGELLAPVDTAAAEAHLRHAVEVATAQGVVPYEARARKSLEDFQAGRGTSPT